MGTRQRRSFTSELKREAVKLAWIRAAADWLDPLVERHWPDVDGDEAAAVDDH